MLKVNDKVVLVPVEELEEEHKPWKNQEVGVGVITDIDNAGWPWVRWADGKKYTYEPYAVRKVEEEMKTIAVPEQFLKDLYEIKCVPDLKAALEKHFGEVVKPEVEWPLPQRGLIFVSKRNGQQPHICAKNNDEPFIQELYGRARYGTYNDQARVDLRPMRSGTITVQVRNGKVAGATVQED